MTKKDTDVAKKLMMALCEEVNVQFDEERWNQSIKRRLAEDEIWGIHFLLLAEENNKVCGIAISEVREKILGALDYYGYIDNVYVLPEYREKGVGTQLLLELIKSLKRSNVLKVRLNVRSDNGEAVKILKKLGFKEVLKSMEKDI